MPRNAEGKFEYDVLAAVTLDKNRIMGGRQLTLLAENAEQQKKMAQEIAITLKADVVKLSFGDYLVIRT
ncbi:hypothetical protein DFO73_101448 [Cytobacillus oceanisediminis]|uniref:Uncharacterized protein n=1 Tax=Cytobacillus oceanisediminis TaxID=665099 RepID=A0A2V3AEC9_9BACI|nr:hypothetical protein [Cytobacillus oceanisediminis]PWW32185.1 hypothetical protein DFO73_101448 [Cytobacillus oceanisediminis]